MKGSYFVAVLFMYGGVVAAEEIGSGRDRDIPDAPPPAEPASSDAPDNYFHELLECFGLDVEQHEA